MLCIICNEHPEKIWPKRWQCWKDNGKFAEALCKLLGLPSSPYKSDFQNASYCQSCQKRVYNTYLVMRKWDKLQEEIGRLKNRMKRDFQESLNKSDWSGGSAGEETNRRSSDEGWGVTTSRHNVKERKWSLDGDSSPELDPNTAVRRRILRKLDKINMDCGCCSLPREHQQQRPAPIQRGGGSVEKRQSISLCGFPDCQDKDCKGQWKEQDGDSDFSSSDSEWSSQEEPCTDKNCTLCLSPPPADEAKNDKPEEEITVIKQEKHESSKFCHDCDLCKHEHEARKSKKRQPSIDQDVKIIKIEKLSPPPEDVDTTSQAEVTSTKKLKSRFRCARNNCSRTFSSQDDLDVHIMKYHEGIKCPFLCDKCGQAFQWRRELEAHVLKHTGGFAVRCQVCGRGFRTKTLLNVHVKTKHGGEKKYKCSVCGMAFITESKLNTHMTIHTKVYPFSCPICGKGFSAKTFLHFHMHVHMEGTPYQCSSCFKAFKSPRNLRIHQYTHNNQHPHKCSVCGTGAASSAHLKKHMLKHKENTSQFCYVCDKKFRFPSSLKKHMKIHQGQEKQFKCDICYKTFYDKYKLSRHVLTHSTDKTFQCSRCSQSFDTVDLLNTHTSEIHGPALQKSPPIAESTEQTSGDSVLEEEEEESLPTPNLPSPPTFDEEFSVDNLPLPEINETLSAYLPDGFNTDSFLDNLNPEDDNLVVTALDLHRFTKAELRLTDKEADHLPENNVLEACTDDNTNLLPDFQTLRNSSAKITYDFSALYSRNFK